MAPQTKEPRSTTSLSAIMMGLSLVAMLSPLAMYHAAQVAAASGWRRAMALLSLVMLALLVLALASGQPVLLLSAIHAFVWLLPFAVVLALRQKGGVPNLVGAVLVLALVPALALGVLLFPEQVPDLAQVIRDAHESLRQAATATGTGPAAQDLDRLAGLLDQGLKSPEFQDMRRLFESPRTDRLLWVIFGGGSSWLFGLLLTTAGNLILLDLAFEQLHKLRAALSHVQHFPERFPQALVAAAPMMISSLRPEPQPTFAVERVSSADATASTSVGSGTGSSALRWLLRPASAADDVVLMGMRFRLVPNVPSSQLWRLRHRRMPLAVALACVAALLGAGLMQSAVAPGMEPSPMPAAPWWLAALALVGLVGSTWLAIEGALVLLARVNPLVLMIALLVALFAGSSVAANPLLVIAVLGAVGLLDHLYDFRGPTKHSA